MQRWLQRSGSRMNHRHTPTRCSAADSRAHRNKSRLLHMIKYHYKKCTLSFRGGKMSCALRAVTCLRNVNVYQSRFLSHVYRRRPSPSQGRMPEKTAKREGGSTFPVSRMLHIMTLSSPTDDSGSDEDLSNCVLVPRGCSPSISVASSSACIPIPLSCSPHGTVVFSSSPSSSLPPLPCGSSPRRTPSPRSDAPFGQGSLRLSNANRNSSSSLLSMSTCSDTSYILGR